MDMTRRRALRLIAITSCSGLASGFVHAQGRLRIAFANYNDEASFGALVLRGMQEAAKRHPELEVSFYDNRQDGARAVEIARTVATIKPDAFIEYNSIVPQANLQIARIMKDAGVPVLSIQVRVPGTPLYAVDNMLAGVESGRGAAEAAEARWGDTDKSFLLLSLPEGGTLFRERTQGAEKGILSVFPGATLQEASTKNDPAVARQVTTDFLTRTC